MSMIATRIFCRRRKLRSMNCPAPHTLDSNILHKSVAELLDLRFEVQIMPARHERIQHECTKRAIRFGNRPDQIDRVCGEVSWASDEIDYTIDDRIVKHVVAETIG